MSEAFDLTDPATELAGLWEWLSETDGSEPAFTVLERLFKGEANSVDLLEVLSVVGQRIRRLVKFAHSVDDPFITDRVRKNLIKHLNKMSQMFVPNQLVQPWHEYKAKYINEEQITTLESVSSRVRAHQPLKLIGDEDRIHLIERIDDILEENTFSEIPAWAQIPLRSGLERVQFSLKYIKFFGHEHILDGILSLKQRAETIELAINDNLEHKTSNENKTSIADIVKILLLGANLFIVPHDIGEAYKTYQGYLLPNQAKEIKLLTGPDTKALPPPKQLAVKPRRPQLPKPTPADE